ncbi:MAG TPA: histidine phosphatase family protein [Streptosporangiaceae bacterium]
MTGKQLIVMRHAKAGELPGGPDEERALRGRGRHDAADAGKWLRHRGFVPDQVICSAARRARQTWHYAGAELADGLPVTNDPRLYQAGAAELLDIIAGTAPEVGTLMYVGHNPAAAELAAALTGQELAFPTAAIAVIALPSHWADLAEGTGALTAHWTPSHS